MSQIDILRENATTARIAIIVAPYMKSDALRFVLDLLSPATTLQCVSRWRLPDFTDGASDIECFDQVIGRGGTFYLHQRLHAKYFRFDDRVLIGSTNITRNGLGLSSMTNFEILHSPDDSFDFISFESQLFNESTVLDQTEVDIWRKLSDLEQNQLHAGVNYALALDNWIPRTREPFHVWLAYRGDREQIISADERRLAIREVQQLMLPDALGRSDFDMLLAARMLGSSRIHDVRVSLEYGRTAGWDYLGAKWGVSRSVAARTQSTVVNWLREIGIGPR